MGNAIDLTGQRFGRLTVIERANNSASGSAKWVCKCDCGKEVIVSGVNLRLHPDNKSCGCISRSDILKNASEKCRVTDLLGMKFGMLTVIERVNKEDRGKAQWKCKCDCGAETIVTGCHLTSGHTKSCGCLRNSMSRKRMTTHGMTGTRLHNIWNGMRARCFIETTQAYHHYGGRGIKVCDEWLDFEVFYKWAIENGWSENSVGISIDRIDVNGDYCPENCRFATTIEQANNKRNNVRIYFDGKNKTVHEWSADVGVKSETILYRIKSGWSVEEALFTPTLSKGKKRIKIHEEE